MTQRNIVALEAEGRERYLPVFFVCLFVALCSTLFCFPSFLPSLFLLLTLSLFCRVELTLTHFSLARKKMMIIVEVVVVVGFNCV